MNEKDPVLEQIWETRRKISERFDHDPKKMVEFYQKKHAQYVAEQELLRTSKTTSKSS